MPCVHVFRSANHQLGLYLRRMFVPRSKNVVSNAEIHDVGGLKSTAKVSLYDHDYGPSYYARCHKVVAQCTVLLYVRHGLELGCSSWSVFSTDGDRGKCGNFRGSFVKVESILNPSLNPILNIILIIK